MSEEELIYANNIRTHVDLLVSNTVSKRPILGIEIDGYSYHKKGTRQHEHDMMKDHIFSLYSLPLLRLSTRGSGEKEKIIDTLKKLI